MSNLRLINETSTTTGVASLSVTDVFSSDYDIYQVTFTDTELAAIDWVELRFINSSGSVVTASKYDGAVSELDAGSSYGEGRETNDTNFSRLIRSQTTEAKGGVASIWIFNPYSSSSFTFGLAQSFGTITNGFGTKGQFALKQTSSITGFKIYLNGGSNINKSTIRTYGLRVD
mgnify:CR=1 FL=1